MPSIIRSDPKAREKPCLRCGYSLRRILDAKHCPECGLSIWLSLNQNDALDWSNPEWLRRMSLATLVMAIAQLPAIAAWAFTYWWFARYAWPVLLAGVYFVLFGAGLLLLSSPENRHPDRSEGYRLAGRIVAVAALLLGVLLITRALGPAGRQYAFYLWMEPWSVRLVHCVLFAGSACAFSYLRHLARRIPAPRIDRVSGYVPWAVLLGLLGTMRFFLYATFLYWLLYAFQYLPWVYLPVSAVLLTWFSLTFLHTSRSAAAHWASETAPGASAS